MLALLIAVALAPPSDPARVTKPGSTVRLFDTSDSARACQDARGADTKADLDAQLAAAKAGSRRAPTPKGTADEICDAGTLVKLAPLTRLSVVRTEDGYSLVRVVAGKNAGKQGWTPTAQLAKSAAEAVAEQEQQRQQADAATAAPEGEQEEATVRRIYTETKEALRRACEAFDRSAKLRYIRAQAPSDGARLDAYVSALEEQRDCLLMAVNAGDEAAAEAARRLLDMIPPKVAQ